MAEPRTVAGRGFCAKAAHMLLAAVLANRFLSASGTILPINTALEPADHAATAALALSYTVSISGRVGYTTRICQTA